MKTCLIVDDSSVIRKVARRILEGLEFKIEEAEDGEQALDVCRRGLPEAILLDWHMPVMNGGSEIEFFRLARHGETVKLKARYASITEKETSKGPIILIVSETDYMTGDGELLVRQRHTRIRKPVKK